MSIDDRPLGYWLKSLDQLIEDTFAQTLRNHGIIRRHWQLMNVLVSGVHAKEGIAAALAPFWVEGAITADQALADLIAAGWVTQETYALNDAGRAVFAEIAAEVVGVRERTTAGLSDDDYRATVRNLRQMVENLS